MRFAPILFFMDFAQTLLAWYPDHKRDLPWRDTPNPYHIWLSEVILQQTRVKQGLPYYLAFVELFPTVQDLANASEELVMRTWQGLGYYSRARNMHATAKIIAQTWQGNFPTNKAELIKLKGIGEYTASAIASFAFGEQVAVVDGNVFRVLARFFGIEADISSPKGVKQFQELAKTLLPTQQSQTYNQAIMEFGALQCTPQKPNCMFCPLQASCVAHATGRQDSLPVKTQKIKQKERYFHYIVLQQAGKYALRKREVGDIWAGLYDFVWQESKETLPLEQHDFLQNATFDFTLLNESPYLKHQLTHQTLFVKFWVLSVGEAEIVDFQANTYSWYTLDEVKALPKPILLANFVEQYLV
jgi:A/G-specific adenine glycosylase